MSEKTLLILTKDANLDLSLRHVASQHEYKPISLQSTHEIQNIYHLYKPNLIVLDLHFGEMDGVLLLNYLYHIRCNSPIILIGGEDERLLLAIKCIGQAKGLKIQGAFKKSLTEVEFEKKLLIIDKKSAPFSPTEIARALENKHFVIYYQPQIEIKTKKLCGFEALIRWELLGNIVEPEEFILTSEESGLIVPITHYVIRKVFEQCHWFIQKGPLLRISINLSPKILTDLAFPDEMEGLLKEFKIPANNICLEVTESGISHQSETILEVLTRLRIMGFLLSIDNFGTGYSSIAELQRLPFTELKLDKSFILDLAENKSTQIIVRSSIELGHNLGLTLVAEGVETEAPMNLLESLNCGIAQGYLISKAIPVNNLENWFSQHIDHNLIWRI